LIVEPQCDGFANDFREIPDRDSGSDDTAGRGRVLPGELSAPSIGFVHNTSMPFEASEHVNSTGDG